MPFSWDRRIARAGELAQKYPAASELLVFYQKIAGFQKSVCQRLASLREHDLPVLLPFFPELISLARRNGSAALAQAADTLDQDSAQDHVAMLESVWQHQVESHLLASESAFFAQALLQPYAEYLAGTVSSVADGLPPLCPFCGSKPLLAVLRPEGDGAKRFLLCSLCSTEWAFRRVLCPNCGEENKDKLPIFTAEEFDYVRVEACDSCRSCIKSVDLSKNGHAVPVVDELATVSLNFWARQNNYQTLRPNLFGA